MITFSEYSKGTSITSQYANRGIIFSGDSPFISGDGSNPTSPVLSGSPKFQGKIEGRFVNHDNNDEPTIVNKFSLDAGYFNNIGSTRIQWFDDKGTLLGQKLNTKKGIQNFLIEGGDISRWVIETVSHEAAGYAIDNVSIDNSISASILFREKNDDSKDGTFGYKDDEIPGFDHSALHFNNIVYESHPGYESGTYVSADGTESVFIMFLM